MRRRGLLGVLLAGGALAGCRRGGEEGRAPGEPRAVGEPIRNYEGVPFATPAPLAAREDAIQRAALAQRWVVEQRGPRLLRATYTQRRYQAVVEIPYERDSFSIRYVSGQNLDTVTPGHVIRDYNSWVDALQRAIAAGR